MKQERVKVCTKCGEEKALVEFGVERKVRDGRQAACRNCECIRIAKYKRENRPIISEGQRRYRARFPNKDRLLGKAHKSKQRLELSDYYVKRTIYERSLLKSRDIPEKLIKAKREYLKLGRILKGLNNENNQRSKRKTGCIIKATGIWHNGY